MPSAGIGHALRGIAGSPLTWVVGDLDRWTSRAELLPRIENVVYLDVEDLTELRLRDGHPQVIISPLIMRRTDVLEIARVLHLSQFQGRYRIIAEALPNQRMVLSEIRAVAPGVDVGIVNLMDGKTMPPR